MLNPTSVARNTDPVTSHLAAVGSPGRTTQLHRLLLAFALTGRSLSDEQAAEEAGVSPRSCWWKRCSELRETGMIAQFTDEQNRPLYVTSSQGKRVMACVITPQGRQYLRSEGLYGA